MLISESMEKLTKTQRKRQLVSVLLWGLQKEPKAEQQADKPSYAVASPAAPARPAHRPNVIYSIDLSVGKALNCTLEITNALHTVFHYAVSIYALQ